MEDAMFRSNYPTRSSRLFSEEFPLVPRSLQKTLDSVLQDVWEPYVTSQRFAFSPQIDVEEDEKQVRVLAELPGMNEEDIEIVYEGSPVPTTPPTKNPTSKPTPSPTNETTNVSMSNK